jgi:hypothetical protein
LIKIINDPHGKTSIDKKEEEEKISKIKESVMKNKVSDETYNRKLLI